jgi:CBS domain-containing protein
MGGPAVTVSVGAMLDEALLKMVRAGLRHLAVVDGGGHCLGVLSDRAIAAAWATDYTARLMGASGVDAVAVVDDQGRPVGLVTGSDLVRLLAR